MFMKRKFIEAEVASRCQLSGEFRLIVRGPDGNVRRDTGFFSNLILDAGLNRIGTNVANGYCSIGTGTTAPSALQTALQSLSASTSTQQSSSYSVAASSPYYLQHDLTYRFALGALNGNYTEVGIGWGATTLFSRALIVDGGGSPTSISVASSEQLDVVYRLRMYHPTSDWGGTFTIGGVSTDVVGRTSSATTNAWNTSGSALTQSSGLGPVRNSGIYTTAYTGTIGAVTGTPSGSAGYPGTVALSAYSNNSYSRTGTISFGLTDGNIGGIRSVDNLATNGMTPQQYQFTPAVAKDGTKTLVLTVTGSWARRP